MIKFCRKIFTKMIEKDLQFLGLSDEETKIYLTLLKFGTSPVTQIARLTKIGRVNCYHHIQKLIQKGLISQSQKSKVKQFSAENPRIFLNREKERTNVAQELIPQLIALSAGSSQKPRIQLFEGKSGIRNILETMTELKGGEIVSFANFEKMTEFLPEFLLKEHFQKRIQNKIKTRFIAPWTENSENFRTQFFPKEFNENLLETFLISPKEFHFESEISIFGGSIAIMNLNEQNPVGVLIENAELFRTQKAIFDLAWLGATSFITQ